MVTAVLLPDLSVDSLPEQERWELVVLLKEDPMDEASRREVSSRDIAKNLRFLVPVDAERPGLGWRTATYALPTLLTPPLHSSLEGVVEGEGMVEGIEGGTVEGVIKGTIEGVVEDAVCLGQERLPLAPLPMGMMASILS